MTIWKCKSRKTLSNEIIVAAKERLVQLPTNKKTHENIVQNFKKEVMSA